MPQVSAYDTSGNQFALFPDAVLRKVDPDIVAVSSTSSQELARIPKTSGVAVVDEADNGRFYLDSSAQDQGNDIVILTPPLDENRTDQPPQTEVTRLPRPPWRRL
jgi:hypothetical protein